MGFDGNVAMWSAIVGFFMPLVISVLNQPRWVPAVRGILAFVASMIAAGGTAYFTGSLSNSGDVTTAALTIFSTTIITYAHWWKPSNIAPRIEYATSGRDFSEYNKDKLAQPPAPVKVVDHTGATTLFKPR